MEKMYTGTSKTFLKMASGRMHTPHPELGISQTVSRIPQLRNLNCALSKLF